jgi:hypothetical protein
MSDDFVRPGDLICSTERWVFGTQNINSYLQKLGLQNKRAVRLIDDNGLLRSQWYPTLNGKKYCKFFDYDITSHDKNGKATRHRGQSLRWLPNTLEEVLA